LKVVVPPPAASLKWTIRSPLLSVEMPAKPSCDRPLALMML